MVTLVKINAFEPPKFKYLKHLSDVKKFAGNVMILQNKSHRLIVN